MLAAERAADHDRGVALTARGLAVVFIPVLVPRQVQARAGAQLDDGERAATPLGDERECRIEIRAATDFVGLDASGSEQGLDRLASIETESSERREGRGRGGVVWRGRVVRRGASAWRRSRQKALNDGKPPPAGRGDGVRLG